LVRLFPVTPRPNASHGPLILEVSISHITTHHSRQDSSGRVISWLQRTLPHKTKSFPRRNSNSQSQ